MKCQIESCNESARYHQIQNITPSDTLENLSEKFEIVIPLCVLHAILSQSGESNISIKTISNA